MESAIKPKRRSSSVQSARKPSTSTAAAAAAKTPGSAMVRKKQHVRRASEADIVLSSPSSSDEDRVAAKLMSGELEDMTVAQLQDELRTLGAKVSGRKQELIERLRDLRLQPAAASVASKQALVMKTPHGKKQVFEIVVRRKGSDTEEKEDSDSEIKEKEVVTTLMTGTTATTAANPSGSGSGSSKPEDISKKPSDDVKGAPSSGGAPSLGPTAGEPKAPSALGISPAPPAPSASPMSPAATAAPAMDIRLLRVQYPGKPADTIRFDLNEKTVVETVSAMVRSLFPNEKVNLDPKLDAEPVYLMDEYEELYVVTLDFLRNCPTPNDPPAQIYQVRKDAIPTTIKDDVLKSYVFRLAILATVVQFLIGSAMISPRTLLSHLPQPGSLGLFNALHDWVGLGYPASFFLSILHLGTWFLASAFLSPVYRFSLKLWYPRFRAMRVDLRKAWKRMRAEWERRWQSFRARLSGHGRPLPARLRLGVRSCWVWLVSKRSLTSDLTSRVREYLPEGLVITFVCFMFNFSLGYTVSMLMLSFIRPSRSSIVALWQGELNLEDVLWEMLVESIRFPGYEMNLSTVGLVGAPSGIQNVGISETAVKLKWNAPSVEPTVITSSGRSYGVGVSRYVVTVHAGDVRVLSLECSAPSRDWSRRASLEELAYAGTIIFQVFAIHPGLATLLGLIMAYSCTTAPDAPHKPASMVIDSLVPNTEYSIFVSAVDDLNRIGVASQVLTVRTRPKTLFRRLLLASEEIAIPPPKPAPPPKADVLLERIASKVDDLTRLGVPLPAAAPAPPPAPPAPFVPPASNGSIRYAGVVWNVAMDEKETDLFLRTMRSAALPNPRKEKFEADFIFSSESKSVHQAVTPSFLRSLALAAFNPGLSLRAWYNDPLLIVHPAGTRHTFAPESIYNHMVLSKSRMDWALNAFILGLVLSYSYMYSQAKSVGKTDEFWRATYVDLLRTLIQMSIVSNAMVLLLKRATDMYRTMAGPLQARVSRQAERSINRALDVVEPDRDAVFTRTLILGITSLALSSLALYINGVASFSGLATSLIILNLSRAGGDARAPGMLRDVIRGQVRLVMGPIAAWLPRFIPEVAVSFGIATLAGWLAWILSPSVTTGVVAAPTVFLMIQTVLSL